MDMQTEIQLRILQDYNVCASTHNLETLCTVMLCSYYGDTMQILQFQVQASTLKTLAAIPYQVGNCGNPKELKIL